MKPRNALIPLLIVLMTIGVVNAAPSFVNPTNNQNITADITARILTDQESGSLIIWKYQTSWSVVLTNHSYMPANKEYNVTLTESDVADGNWTLVAQVNGTIGNTSAANSSGLASIGFDDTSPTVTCTYSSRIHYGRTNTITCTITDTGFTSLQGNASVNVKDRLTGINTMIGSSGSYKYSYKERTENNHDFTVTAYDDHGLSTDVTKTIKVLPESSAEEDITTTVAEQQRVITTQQYFFIILIAAALMVLLVLYRRR